MRQAEWDPEETKAISDELVRVTLGGKPHRPKLVYLPGLLAEFTVTFNVAVEQMTVALRKVAQTLAKVRQEQQERDRGE